MLWWSRPYSKTLLYGLFYSKWDQNLLNNIMLHWKWFETRDWGHKLIKKMFTEVIKWEIGSFSHKLTYNWTSFCNQWSSPPAGLYKLKALLHWLQFSEPESLSTIYTVYIYDRHVLYLNVTINNKGKVPLTLTSKLRSSCCECARSTSHWKHHRLYCDIQ